MKTIIVATDYSKSAEDALRYASYIARFTKAKIALLNVYELSTHALNGLIGPSGIDELLRNNQARLSEYANKFSLKFNVEITAYSCSSIIEEAIARLAKKLNAELVVMGMRGNSLEYKLLGNTTTTVLNNTSLPILVVPEGVNFKLPEKLLFACDYKAVPDEGPLEVLRDITTSFGAELQVFHVGKSLELAAVGSSTGSSVIGKIEESLGSVKHSYRDLNTDDVIEGIEDGIRDYNADILVMSPHKYGFWDSLFHKSKTREMVLKANIPLLSIPS